MLASPEAARPFAGIVRIALEHAQSLDDGAQLLLEAAIYCGGHDFPEVAAMLLDLSDAVRAEVDR